RATGLLVVMTVVFVVVSLIGHGRCWLGWVQAGAEASRVGGLADWFAVTALFRHPMGIPIPHTAVIVERKNQFGETLGNFVQENFLSPEVIAERVRSSGFSRRAADWLSDRDNAAAVAHQGADLAVGLADVVRDDDVHRVLADELARRVDALPLAPLAARVVRLVTTDQRHQELFDAIVRGLERFLEQNREVLRTRYGEESPWWLPDAVDDRISARLFDGVCSLLERVDEDPEHEVRRHFDEWVVSLADRLEASPGLAARAEKLKHEVLQHPELRAWLSSLWGEVKQGLRDQAADPDSELRRRLA